MPRPRVDLNTSGAASILQDAALIADLRRRGEAIRDACASESSWDGYRTATAVEGDRVVTRVWSISSNLPRAHERHQRMIRNLDAGS